MSSTSCQVRFTQSNSGRIIHFDCFRCDNTNNLAKNRCIDSIILAVEGYNNINQIFINNYTRIKLGDSAVKLILKFSKIKSDILLSKTRQVPEPNCRNCEFNPDRVFTKLYDDFDASMDNFLRVFKDLLISMINRETGSARANSCSYCFCDTYRDLTFLFLTFQELSTKIIQEGFSVVLE